MFQKILKIKSVVLVHIFSDVKNYLRWDLSFNALLFELKINCCIELFSTSFRSLSGTFVIDDAVSFPKLCSSVLAFSFYSPSNNALSALDKTSFCVILLLLGYFENF